MTRPSLTAERPAPEWDLQEVRRIVLEKLRGHPAQLYLFGSRARGDARRTSDIDVAVWAQAPLAAELIADIRDALEESLVIYHVDLVDLARVSDDFRKKVLQEGILWND